MELKIKLKDDEARSIEWLLRLRYGSKASLEKLAKQAIRDAAAQSAKDNILTELDKQ